MSFKKHTTPEATWAAERFANMLSQMQDEREMQKEHVCGRCRNPYTVRSLIRCPNDVGGK